MNDEKRLLLAIILSVVVLVGWNFLYVQPQAEKTARNVKTTEQQQDTAQSPTNQNQTGTDSKVSDYQPVKETTFTDVTEEAQNIQMKDFRTISVATPLYNISLSEYGATVTSFTLNNYNETNKKDSLLKELVHKEIKQGLFKLSLQGRSIPNFESAVFKADIFKDETILNSGDKKISFTWTSQDGVIFEKIFTFYADTYLIDCDIVIKNGGQMSLNDSLGISVAGYMDKAAEKEARFTFAGPIGLVSEELQEISKDDIEDKDTYNGSIAWAGYTGRYFLSCVIPDEPVNGELKVTNLNDVLTATFYHPMERIDPGKMTTIPLSYFMGPKSLTILKQAKSSLTEAVNFGWFTILAKPLLITMNYIYKILPNYGVAIILLTVLIKILLWPLGTKSYKSMNEMKKVQPLMQEIREKYKDDKQKMNKEVMALYKTYKVNPVSGCLPMLAQMPIFFALYRMLYQAIELRHAPFMGWIQDLSAPDRLFNFGFSIPFMQEPYGIPLLTIIMGATFFLQQKMTPTAGDPMQAKMMMLMPIFMTVIFINFPAGLVLYFFANNIISMGQQYYIQKKFS
ncbi:MAG: membrane protein insertase YidC [Desulfobacteraceae bacterium]|nr:membrane protein insertase YidC [Desulfobacteraceae bacterium]